jgi:uncharacterized LabA/DUF88 family protein
MTAVRIRQVGCLFVDMANFRRYFDENTLKWAGVKAPINYEALAKTKDSKKAFFYDCIDDRRKPGETDVDYNARIKEQEDEFAKISSIENTHVKLGSMTGTYKNRRQKGVDISLAVDTLRHAERGNMKIALLVTGDGDFKPLVQALVEMGLFAWVMGDKKHTSEELRLAADRYIPLTLKDYFNFVFPDFAHRYSLPESFHSFNHLPTNGYKKVGDCTVNGIKAERFMNGEIGGIAIYFEPSRPLNIFGLLPERIKLYCELMYGPVII